VLISQSSLPDFITIIVRAVIVPMMEAAGASETSANFYQTTRRNNPEDSHLDIVLACRSL
jgi:hypothetical protein